MGVYTVDPDIARAIVRRRSLLMMVLVALLAGSYAAMDIARGDRERLAIDLAVGLLLLAFAAIAVLGSHRRAIGRLTSFRLIVSPEEISWERPDVLKHVLPRKDVRRILLDSSGNVVVGAARRWDSIRIPSAIGSKDALLAELSDWRPLEKGHLPAWLIHVLRALAVIAGLAAVVFLHGPVAWTLMALGCGIAAVGNWSKQQELSERLRPLWIVPAIALNFFFHAQNSTRAAHRAELRQQVEACQARSEAIADRTTDKIWRLNELRRSLDESGRKLKGLKPSKAGHRQLLEMHDDNLRKYNALEAALKSDLAEYDAVAAEHNALVSAYNALLKR
jgi:hypothetical protein